MCEHLWASLRTLHHRKLSLLWKAAQPAAAQHAYGQGFYHRKQALLRTDGKQVQNSAWLGWRRWYSNRAHACLVRAWYYVTRFAYVCLPQTEHRRA
jgi:hypothetical protein